MGRRIIRRELTDVLEHLIALVENENLEVIEVQRLVLGEVEDTAWGANDDVRSAWALQHLLLLLERLAAQEALRSHVRHEFGETSEFTLDLVGELAGVSEDEGAAGLGVLVEAMKRGEDENGSLAHAGYGLAKDIDAHDGLRDALLLHVTGVLKTAIHDGLLELRAQDHVFETRGVDAHVIGRRLGSTSSGGGSRSAVNGNGTHRLKVDVVLVVVGKVGVLLGFYHSMGNYVNSCEICRGICLNCLCNFRVNDCAVR